MATLGSQVVGSIVKLNVGGTARNWIVVHQGLPGSMYDASCDGTWLLMDEIYEKRVFDSTDHDYANSDIHSYLNGTFINLFDSDIKNVIKQVKIPYTPGTRSTSVSSGANGLSAKIFLLSYPETGLSGNTNVPVAGSPLSYFNGAANSKRVAYYNTKDPTIWFLRSPEKRSAWYVMTISTTGTAQFNYNDDTHGVRPAMILPGELSVSSDGSVTLASGAITGSVNIGGVHRELTGKGYINIGGVLRELSDSQVIIGGILKSLKG